MVIQIYFPHLHLKFCFTEAEDPVVMEKANQKQQQQKNLNLCSVLYDSFLFH